jgi:hypothetical protein
MVSRLKNGESGLQRFRDIAALRFDRHDYRGDALRQESPRAARRRRRETDLGLQFLRAAKTGDADKLKNLLRKGAPVNLVDPVNRAAALHYIAAYDARPALRVVLKCAELDYLVLDRDGKFPSELAREVGNDEGMARLLLIKEMRQARAWRIDPAVMYRVSPRKPAA